MRDPIGSVVISQEGFRVLRMSHHNSTFPESTLDRVVHSPVDCISFVVIEAKIRVGWEVALLASSRGRIRGYSGTRRETRMIGPIDFRFISFQEERCTVKSL